MLLRYLYWCEEHCYLSSTDNKLWSYIFPSYLLKRLHNEIDWEKKKTHIWKSSQKKVVAVVVVGNKRYKDQWLLYQETVDSQVTEEFDISEERKGRKDTSDKLWRNSLRVLYK